MTITNHKQHHCNHRKPAAARRPLSSSTVPAAFMDSTSSTSVTISMTSSQQRRQLQRHAYVHIQGVGGSGRRNNSTASQCRTTTTAFLVEPDVSRIRSIFLMMMTTTTTINDKVGGSSYLSAPVSQPLQPLSSSPPGRGRHQLQRKQQQQQKYRRPTSWTHDYFVPSVSAYRKSQLCRHHFRHRCGIQQMFSTIVLFLALFCISEISNDRIVIVAKADQVETTTSPAPSEAIITPVPSMGADTPVVAPVGSDAPSGTDAPVGTEPTESVPSSPTDQVPTAFPSDVPSAIPSQSFSPSTTPTVAPTMSPTFGQIVTSTGRFSQRFDVGNGQLFSDQELFLIEGLYRSYTPNFAQPPGSVASGLITTVCTIDNQVEIVPTVDDSSPGSRQRRQLATVGCQIECEKKNKRVNFDPHLRQQKNALLRRSHSNITHVSRNSSTTAQTFTSHSAMLNRTGTDVWQRQNRIKDDKQQAICDNRKCNRNKKRFNRDFTLSSSMSMPHLKRRRLQNVQVIQLDYTMSYESQAINVSLYPVLFQNFVNSNLEQVTLQMQTLGLNVTGAQIANRIIPRTAAPSVSLAPSMAPTGAPTSSAVPTMTPSVSPSFSPPTGGGGNDGIIIGISVVVAVLVVGIGLMIWCRSRKQRREMKHQNISLKQSSPPGMGRDQGYEGSGWDGAGEPAHPSYDSNNNYYGSDDNPDMHNPPYQHYGAQDEELAGTPNQSFLSAGNPMGGGSIGGIESDATQMLADEFDQYQDHDLERMRADVEGNLEGCDGMMNQAVARALIDEDVDILDSENATDYLWGCPLGSTGVQVEAGVLWYVADWLKRNSHSSVEEKRSFMQEILNKMVVSVRKGYVGPDDASRTIHECGALLGVQLAAEMPSTTIAITGLRKNATAQDIGRAFRIFGHVVVAEVAPNQRGFGILRFSTEDAVNKAVQKYQTDGEVVVQDVGVQLKAIRPDTLTMDNGDGPTNGNGQIP